MNRADYGFLLDESQSSDPITARFPRTARQAFGHYAADPAPSRVTFLQRGRTGWAGIAAAVLMLASVIFWSVK